MYPMTGSKAPLNLRTLWRFINLYYLLTYLLTNIIIALAVTVIIGLAHKLKETDDLRRQLSLCPPSTGN